jgi:signal transduction histidine kinase
VNLRTILTSFTFRYLLLYLLALSTAVFIVMAGILAFFTHGYFQELRESLVDELDTVSAVYSGQGVAGLEQYIQDRSVAVDGRRFQYLLTDRDYEKLAGSLERWPEFREFGDGWVSFGLTLAGAEDEDELLGRPQALDAGHLLVALRYSDVMESVMLVFRTLVRTMIATVLLGIVGGIFAAAHTLRRVERVNQGIDDIVHGDLSQRIPLGDATGNVRTLIENFNSMLDQTESLMHGVRTVSDNIAHDLRTPLTRMRNMLSQLKQESSPEARDRVQSIIEECDGILSTFNALLRIAQLEAGNRISSFGEVDMTALVQDVIELYEPLAQEKDISLESDCASGVLCDGDRDLIFQMLANLLDNAVKYTPPGGGIRVQLNADAAGQPSLAVVDSGPGIPEPDREAVFQRFVRLESSRSEHPGSGLGLSLVKAVVNLHRGSVKLLDNHPGLRVEVALG